MDAPRILMLEVAEQVAAVTLVSHLPGIQAVSDCRSDFYRHRLMERFQGCTPLASSW